MTNIYLYVMNNDRALYDRFIRIQKMMEKRLAHGKPCDPNYLAQSATMKNLICMAVSYAATLGEHYSKAELELAAIELANEAINEASCPF